MMKTKSMLAVLVVMALSQSALSQNISQSQNLTNTHSQFNSRSVLHGHYVGNGYIFDGTEVGNGFKMKEVCEGWKVGNG